MTIINRWKTDVSRDLLISLPPQNQGLRKVGKKDGTNGGKQVASVGVVVVQDGEILTGTRHNDFGYGLICGPGGHIEEGESPGQAAIRETEEEFGITPTDLIFLGRGPEEPGTGLAPYLFLCTDFEGEPDCIDLEMANPKFRTLEEIEQLEASLFQAFADGIKVLKSCVAPL